MTCLYLDHNATTPLHPKALEAMTPFLTESYGNASSNHPYGWKAEEALKKSRDFLLAAMGGFGKGDFIFTSGTTESNNLVIKGLALGLKRHSEKVHFISQVTEHSCVLESLKFAESLGVEVTLLPVDESGFVRELDLKKAIKPHTKLVSIMHANNEVGTIQDLKQLIEIVRNSSEAYFHTDAAQTFGKIAFDLNELDLDFVSVSSHKCYGPKGIGGFYISKNVRRSDLIPLISGGGHEQGLRSGTVNIAGAVGFAKALEVTLPELKSEAERQIQIRDKIVSRFLNEVPHCSLNGTATNRLPNNISLTILGVDSADLMIKTPTLAFSSGSACASGTTKPSHVIQALGKGADEAKWTIRLAIGRSTTEDNADFAVEELKQRIEKLRKDSIIYEMAVSQIDK